MAHENFAAAMYATGIPVPAGSVSASVYLRYVYDVSKALNLRVARFDTPEAFVRERTDFFKYTPATRIEITPERVWDALVKKQRTAFVARRNIPASGMKRTREPEVPPATEGGSVSSNISSDTGLMDLPTEMRTVIRRFLSKADQGTLDLVSKQFATEAGEGWHILCRELVRHFHPSLPKAAACETMEAVAEDTTGAALARARGVYFGALRALAAKMSASVRSLIEDFEDRDGYYMDPHCLECKLVRDKRDFTSYRSDNLWRLSPEGVDEERTKLEGQDGDYFCFFVDIPKDLVAEHPRLRAALKAANDQLAVDSRERDYSKSQTVLKALFFILLSEVDPLAVLVHTTEYEDARPFISLLGIETNGVERERTAHPAHRLDDLPHYHDLDDEFFNAVDAPRPDDDDYEEDEDE